VTAIFYLFANELIGTIDVPAPILQIIQAGLEAINIL
jgi:hypothetical protein